MTIDDSYIHNLFNSAQSHTDGIQFAGGHYQIVDGKYVRDSHGNPVELSNAANITIRHNTIYSYNTSDHQDGTSAIISNHGSDVNVLIDSNLMAGGAYTLRPGRHRRQLPDHQQPFQPGVPPVRGGVRPDDVLLRRDEQRQRHPRDRPGRPARLSRSSFETLDACTPPRGCRRPTFPRNPRIRSVDRKGSGDDRQDQPGERRPYPPSASSAFRQATVLTHRPSYQPAFFIAVSTVRDQPVVSSALTSPPEVEACHQ